MANNNVLDELVLRARELADTAGKKTADLYEVSKYKYECIRLNGEIKRLYEQLGSSVYSMIKGGYDNDDLVDSLCEDIDERLARLKEINRIIAGKKSLTVCPVCGTKNSLENTYCAKCGSRLKNPAAGTASGGGECCAPDDDEAAGE